MKPVEDFEIQQLRKENERMRDQLESLERVTEEARIIYALFEKVL